jgi:hypothetical protein
VIYLHQRNGCVEYWLGTFHDERAFALRDYPGHNFGVSNVGFLLPYHRSRKPLGRNGVE